MSNENNCQAKFTTFNALAEGTAKAVALANWRHSEEESKRQPRASEGAKAVAHNVHP